MTPRQHRQRSGWSWCSGDQLAPLACSQPCGPPRQVLKGVRRKGQKDRLSARGAASACNCWTLLQEEFQEEEYQGFTANQCSI